MNHVLLSYRKVKENPYDDPNAESALIFIAFPKLARKNMILIIHLSNLKMKMSTKHQVCSIYKEISKHLWLICLFQISHPLFENG